MTSPVKNVTYFPKELPETDESRRKSSVFNRQKSKMPASNTPTNTPPQKEQNKKGRKKSPHQSKSAVKTAGEKKTKKNIFQRLFSRKKKPSPSSRSHTIVTQNTQMNTLNTQSVQASIKSLPTTQNKSTISMKTASSNTRFFPKDKAMFKIKIAEGYEMMDHQRGSPVNRPSNNARLRQRKASGLSDHFVSMKTEYVVTEKPQVSETRSHDENENREVVRPKARKAASLDEVLRARRPSLSQQSQTSSERRRQVKLKKAAPSQHGHYHQDAEQESRPDPLALKPKAKSDTETRTSNEEFVTCANDGRATPEPKLEKTPATKEAAKLPDKPTTKFVKPSAKPKVTVKIVETQKVADKNRKTPGSKTPSKDSSAADVKPAETKLVPKTTKQPKEPSKEVKKVLALAKTPDTKTKLPPKDAGKEAKGGSSKLGSKISLAPTEKIPAKTATAATAKIPAKEKATVAVTAKVTAKATEKIPAKATEKIPAKATEKIPAKEKTAVPVVAEKLAEPKTPTKTPDEQKKKKRKVVVRVYEYEVDNTAFLPLLKEGSTIQRRGSDPGLPTVTSPPPPAPAKITPTKPISKDLRTPPAPSPKNATPTKTVPADRKTGAASPKQINTKLIDKTKVVPKS